MLTRQATADVDAVREAHIALACVNKLLLHARSFPGDKGPVSLFELKALAALTKAEVERRLRAAHSTIASMKDIGAVEPRRFEALMEGLPD